MARTRARKCRMWVEITGRDPKPELHPHFRGYPFLAPRAIRRRHVRDQLPQFRRQLWSATAGRLPPPKQPEAFSMPSHERVRLHDGEDATPVDQRRQRTECDAGRDIGPPRLDLALDVQRQLLAQKQILGGEVECGRNINATNRMRRKRRARSCARRAEKTLQCWGM